MKKKTVVAISGGFDPVHIGHTRLIQEARALGDELVIILNNDHWLRTKKGSVFMPEEERVEVLLAIKGVDRVVLTDHTPNDTDRSVVRTLEKLRPDIFANGGDRETTKDVPEHALCEKLGIKLAFGVGSGGKIQSSSWLTKKITDISHATERRPWGSFANLGTGSEWHLKTLSVENGKRTSLQSHKHRTEIWTVVEGSVRVTIGKEQKVLKVGDQCVVAQGELHRIESVNGDAKLVEVSLGTFDENDIVRYEDDFGRTS
jgi:cytidyltransferase-like protein